LDESVELLKASLNSSEEFDKEGHFTTKGKVVPIQLLHVYVVQEQNGHSKVVTLPHLSFL